MSDFKVGDWVRFTPSGEVFKVNYTDDRIRVVIGTKHNGHYDMDFVTEWKPELFEYCWSKYDGVVQVVEIVDDDIEQKYYYVCKPVSQSIQNMTYNIRGLQPFFGELPAFQEEGE
jgi:hypothetical protein